MAAMEVASQWNLEEQVPLDPALDSGHDADAAAAAAPDENPSAVMASMYPSPPNNYKRFTKKNLWCLRVLQDYAVPEGEKPWEELHPTARMERQSRVLSAALSEQNAAKTDAKDDVRGPAVHGYDAPSESELPDFDVLQEMAPPRMDWIREDGSYTVFGVAWPIEDRLPTLEDVGIKRLYAEGPIDRRAVMQSLLRTLLHTHLRLSSAVLSPPNEYSVDMVVGHQPGPDGAMQPVMAPTYRTEAQDLLEHLRLVVINFQHLINEMRPRQAKENLKALLQSQLERRKQQTKALNSECSSIRSRIAALRQDLSAALSDDPATTETKADMHKTGGLSRGGADNESQQSLPSSSKVRIQTDRMDES